jgi:hypothetical protein
MDDQVTSWWRRKKPNGDKRLYLEEGWYTLDDLQAYIDNAKRVEQANYRRRLARRKKKEESKRKEESNE